MEVWWCGSPTLRLALQNVPVTELVKTEDFLDVCVEILRSSEMFSNEYLFQISKALLDCKDEELASEFAAIALTRTQDLFQWVNYGGTTVRVINPFSSVGQIVGDAQLGLKLWEAEIATLEWLEDNSSIIKGANVLELGAGVGLAGFACAQRFSARSVTLTDANSIVVDNLNFINQTLKLESLVTTLQLEWSEEEKFKKLSNFNLILAADCVYDPNEIGILLRCLLWLLSTTLHSKAILTCSIRNEDTFNKMLGELATIPNIYVKQLTPGSERYSVRTTHMLTKNWNRSSIRLFLVKYCHC